MNEMLTVVLSMSLSGGIVIIMLYFVLLLLGKKLCRQWQYYYIWLIAIIRLLLPFAPRQNLMNELFQAVKPPFSGIESFSLGRLQQEQTAAEDSPMNDIQSENTEDKKRYIQLSETNLEFADEIADNISDKEVKGKSYALTEVVRQYVWLIWLLPAMLLFARKIIAYERNLKYIRMESKEVQDLVWLEEFGKLMEKNHIRSRVTLSVNSMILSPVIIGLLNPCIILPTTQMSVLEFRHTISHELVHYRRRDILYKWLTQFVVCIHWFNPLLYIMERSINRACELSCDEAVIWDLDEQERYAYGDTLLRVAGRTVKCKLPVSPIALSDSKKNLKERLDAIMKFKKISKGTYITMFSFTMLLFVIASYVGVYAATKQNAAESGTSKTKTSASYSARADHSVLYKNGEYYILFDHAEEIDIPVSTGPDYGVSFCAVWSDHYVGFDSYFVNKKLSRSIKKECKYYEDKGQLTKKEANAVIDVARKVQQGDTNGFKTSKQEKTVLIKTSAMLRKERWILRL